jgi:hypothetical protein
MKHYKLMGSIVIIVILILVALALNRAQQQDSQAVMPDQNQQQN